jgi:hypothetical protein
LKPLPPAHLLLNLPRLLLLPPTHKNHARSLHLSLVALRRCLSLHSGEGVEVLTPEMECRAWTGLAEVGMRVVGGGFCEPGGGGVGEHGWAKGIEGEVEKAIGKAVRLFSLSLSLSSTHSFTHRPSSPKKTPPSNPTNPT